MIHMFKKNSPLFFDNCLFTERAAAAAEACTGMIEESELSDSPSVNER